MAFNTTRWTLANLLPVLFVWKIIGALWLLYVFLHLVPLLQSTDPVDYHRGVWQTAVSQGLTALMLICFYRAIVTDPGSVPQTPEWRHGRSEGLATEVKQTGEPRFCKWCNQYKPDRCHHCRVCRSCVLRMDHHCPWIANCVGFHNHKFFCLLVFYAMVVCLFISSTMSATLLRAVSREMTTMHRFGIVYCMTLSSLMSVLLVPFLLLHLSFMAKAQTTIEFCEKRSAAKSSGAVSYDQGLLHNARSVLGPNMLLWLLPMSTPEGDGLSFGQALKTASSEPLLPDTLAPKEAPATQQGEAAPMVAPAAQAPAAGRPATTAAAEPSSEGPAAEGALPDKGAGKGAGGATDPIDGAPEVTGARAAEV